MTYPTYLTYDELERRSYIQNDTATYGLAGTCAEQEAQIDLLTEQNRDQLEKLELANVN